MNNSPLIALEKVLELIGGQSALARFCNVKPQTVQVWLRKFKRIPAERVLQVEKSVNGLVSRHQLRPDIYPPD